MKKIIKLTESELKSLIKRIVTENLNETITLHGVTLSPANSKHGGPILTKYKNITNKYSVTVDTALYDGPVGVKYIYKNKKDGKYYITDNTGKTFELPYKKLTYIINSIKNNKNKIETKSPLVDLTLTKK
jgi:hypothetical protein